ncbi:hypothetical protein [Mammaliicoccus sp. P-M59]|uniref:hypothetical protein n=1 Tax=Mammaliicoccus sp. P-M59 TaxID=2898718 RepID=UPI001EFAD661|nr:hypothetical protein [Mammaliicoccus sp. P-M59]
MKPHEMNREEILNKLDIQVYSIYSVTLHEGCDYEGRWLVKTWLFNDIELAKKFINEYRVDKTEEIIKDKMYEIARRHFDSQQLMLEELELTEEIPTLNMGEYWEEDKMYEI